MNSGRNPASEIFEVGRFTFRPYARVLPKTYETVHNHIKAARQGVDVVSIILALFPIFPTLPSEIKNNERIPLDNDCYLLTGTYSL